MDDARQEGYERMSQSAGDPALRSTAEPLTKQDFEELARFRFGIRRYLRRSEEIVRGHGLSPQKYQLMLALMGYPGRDWATVRELADVLQLRHHSVVELIDRAQGQGLVQREQHPTDARAVQVGLTPAGAAMLSQLAALHRDELRRVGPALARPFWEDDCRRLTSVTASAPPSEVAEQRATTHLKDGQ